MEWKQIRLEDAGLSDKIMEVFFSFLKEKRVDLDSMMMVKSGNIVYEKYWEPYHEETVHRIYSAGKSITAIAIGLLIKEGKLSLRDDICNYFFDKLPKEGVHPYIRQMKIYHLLTMTTAHSSTTYKRYDGDWVESFFHLEPAYPPGTEFSYDTSATHVLSALVERVSGMDLFSYLKGKVLDEIGFSKQAYWEKDEAGVTKGGDGLYCTTRDLASVALLCMNGGIYNGKQLIPADYLEEMTSFQVSSAHKSWPEGQFGYGFQTWVNRYFGFTFYGMGGQLAVCFPNKDFILLTTASMIDRSQDIQYFYDGFYENVYPYIK